MKTTPHTYFYAYILILYRLLLSGHTFKSNLVSFLVLLIAKIQACSGA